MEKIKVISKQCYLFRLFFNSLHFHVTHKNSARFSVRNRYTKSLLLFNYYLYFKKPIKY